MGRQNASNGVVVTGGGTRFDLVRDLFLDFNRDPHKNQVLVEHYVKSLGDIDMTLLSMAIDAMRSQDKMPKWTEIKVQAMKESQISRNTAEYIACDFCGGDGLIRSVFKNGRELYKLEPGEKGNLYYCSIIGKCECLNAEAWDYPTTSNPSWIVGYSNVRNVPLSLSADNICTKMNRQAKGL